MSDEEYEEASPAEKLSIATYFIMSSPTGEVHQVVNDVKKLINDDETLSKQAMAKILRAHNVEQMVSGKAGDDQLLVSKHGQVSPNEYLDPDSGKVWKFDHVRGEFGEESEKKQVLDDEVEKYRSAISTLVKAYAESAYKNNKCTVAVYGADNGQITICLSAANVNLGNYWTGGWRSVFTINVSKKGKKSLKGGIKVNVHYFEAGNVQLHGKIEKSEDIEVGEPETTAEAVAGAVAKVEQQYQTSLDEMYVNMHRNTFKGMRRFLPKTRKEMTWSLAAHKVAAEVSNK